MSNLLKENKQVVAPGETIAKGMSYIPGNGTYRVDDEVVSEKIGLVNIHKKIIKVIPLAGSYVPKVNDIIIGRVSGTTARGWKLDINSGYEAYLSTRDTNFGRLKPSARVTKFLDDGEYVSMKVRKKANNMNASCSLKGPKTRKLVGGRVIDVDPTKVPRIIGRKGSMVKMIKKEADVNIVVGINGLVWLKGNYIDEVIAIKAIRKIENESHKSGLTDKVKEYLEELKKEYKNMKKQLDQEGDE